MSLYPDFEKANGKPFLHMQARLPQPKRAKQGPQHKNKKTDAPASGQVKSFNSLETRLPPKSSSTMQTSKRSIWSVNSCSVLCILWWRSSPRIVTAHTNTAMKP